MTAGEVAAEKRVDARRKRMVAASARYIEMDGSVGGDRSGLGLRARIENVRICHRYDS